MVSTRSTRASDGKSSSPKTSKKASCAKPTTAAQKAVARLEIDCTTALGGKQTAPSLKSGPTYKANGAYWLDVDKPVTTKAAGTKRQLVDDAAPDADTQFLGEARRQLKKRRTGRPEVSQMLPYLDQLRQPRHVVRQYSSKSGRGRSKWPVEAYHLSAADARRLLSSHEPVAAPVFVAGGASTEGILEPDSEKRPIEQVLDWFTDPAEHFDTISGKSALSPTLGEIRGRFLHHDSTTRGGSSPWNLPDMAFPFHQPGKPSFVQTKACNFLTDVVRYLTDVSPDSICGGSRSNCPDYDEKTQLCAEHFVTMSQYSAIVTGWRYWQGTVMLAEPGALTMPHVDKWGYGTWISCLEGEIGFAWMSSPTDQELRALHQDGDEPNGRWLYKILRPEDTLYMGPGTPHLVFRLPEGKQTCAIAGHIVRRSDLALWVKMLCFEAQGRLDDGKQDETFRDVVLGLIYGTEHHIEQTRGKQAEKAYGDVNSIGMAEDALEKLESLVSQPRQ